MGKWNKPLVYCFPIFIFLLKLDGWREIVLCLQLVVMYSLAKVQITWYASLSIILTGSQVFSTWASSLDPGQARARFHEHEEAVLIFLLNSSCESQPRLPLLWIERPWRHPAAALSGRIAFLVWTWAEFQVLKIKGENGNGDRPSFQVRYTFKSL